MPSHDIPFFNDIPTKAIAAAGKLWDAAKSPQYNFMAAYGAFVEHCNDAKVAPPARPLVKRFVAGVHAGMIDRPGGDPAPTQAAAEHESQAVDFEGATAYFANLPPTTASVLQSAWDRASAGGFESRFMYETFFRDVAGLGYAGPTRAEFDIWVKGIVKGEIDRPARQISATAIIPAPVDEPHIFNVLKGYDPEFADLNDCPAFVKVGASVILRNGRRATITVVDPMHHHSVKPVLGVFEDGSPVSWMMNGSMWSSGQSGEFDIVAPAVDEPVQPETAQSPTPEIRPWLYQHKAHDERAHRRTTAEPFIPLTPSNFPSGENPLGLLVEKAVEEKTAALQANARDYARKLIAEQLRELADELEGAA